MYNCSWSQKDHLTEIKKILFSDRNDGEEFFLFGSRARGDHDKYSDYDIAIGYHKTTPLPIRRLLSLQGNLSELPWKVDLVDLTRADIDFFKQIQGDLIAL